MLLLLSDYPHWQFDGQKILSSALPASMQARISVDNPLRAFPRLQTDNVWRGQAA